MRQQVEQLQNAKIAFTLYDDGSAEIVDRIRSRRWRMGPVALQEEGPIDIGHVWVRNGRSMCEQYPGRFLVEPAAGKCRYTLRGRLGRVVGTFRVSITLKEDWLEFTLLETDEELPSLVFPPPIESESLVVPQDVGRWVREPVSTTFLAMAAQLKQRWVGGLCGDDGWMCVFGRGHADAGVMLTKLSAMPTWLKSLGRWTMPRTVRYTFTGGGYVGMARRYRELAVAEGLHVSLEEKMDRTPALSNIMGGRLLSFMQAEPSHPERFENWHMPVPADIRGMDGRTRVHVSHRDVADIVGEARAAGMDRGLVVLRGWMNGGYDESHPDIWPPEPGLGTVGELRGLCSLGDPLLVALHDNYQDIYPQTASWPRGAIIRNDGTPMEGGVWAGGQCYILNSLQSIEYERRNWEEMGRLGLRAMFVDTTTSAQFYESWESGNSQTREQDEQRKIQLMAFYKEQGLVFGTEEASDFGGAYFDWLENRHSRVPGQSVPLWPLVFHDCAFATRYTRGGSPGNLERGAPRLLTDMLWGYFPMWWIDSRESWAAHSNSFASAGYVCDWHKRIGADRMTGHRYLAEDFQVERTEWSSGVAITVNFAPEPRQVEARTIPGHGYAVDD